MEATDLRIGNIVFVDNEKHRPNSKGVDHVILQVGLIDCRVKNVITGEEFGQYYKFIKPIHLTEKRLIDFGMEMPINEDPIFEYGKGKYKNCFNDFKKTSQSLIDASFEINGLNFWADSNGFWFNIMMNYTKIEYVHQFQNLYHALTANELKMEEKIKEKASTP